MFALQVRRVGVLLNIGPTQAVEMVSHRCITRRCPSQKVRHTIHISIQIHHVPIPTHRTPNNNFVRAQISPPASLNIAQLSQ